MELPASDGREKKGENAKLAAANAIMTPFSTDDTQPVRWEVHPDPDQPVDILWEVDARRVPAAVSRHRLHAPSGEMVRHGELSGPAEAVRRHLRRWAGEMMGNRLHSDGEASDDLHSDGGDADASSGSSQQEDPDGDPRCAVRRGGPPPFAGAPVEAGGRAVRRMLAEASAAAGSTGEPQGGGGQGGQEGRLFEGAARVCERQPRTEDACTHMRAAARPIPL